MFLVLTIALCVAVYLLACIPAFLLLQRVLIATYRELAEFDLDVLDPPKVHQLPEGPESGVMIDTAVCRYSEMACADIDEQRDFMLDYIIDVIEFRAFRSWPSVQALYAKGHLEDIAGDATVVAEDEKKERRIVLTAVMLRAPLWPIAVGGALAAWFGAKMFIRQVARGDY